MVLNESGSRIIDFNSLNGKNSESFENNTKVQIKLNDYSLVESESAAKDLYTVKNSLEKLQKHDFDYDGIYSMQRCTKCILPITTPFIHFDSDGVCNFCHEHVPISYKGVKELKKLISEILERQSNADYSLSKEYYLELLQAIHKLQSELKNKYRISESSMNKPVRLK